MKKLHFSLLAILFALFAMVSFTACSSDDEDTPSTEDVQTYIIGMWQPTHVTGYDWDENDKPAKVDKDIDIDIDDVVSFEFKQGGTFNEYYWTGNKWKNRLFRRRLYYLRQQINYIRRRRLHQRFRCLYHTEY